MRGHVVELPGYFRISLTATDEKMERSLPVFARAIERARLRHPLPTELAGCFRRAHRALERDTPGSKTRHAGH
jgi:hypothetical protein